VWKSQSREQAQLRRAQLLHFIHNNRIERTAHASGHEQFQRLATQAGEIRLTPLEHQVLQLRNDLPDDFTILDREGTPAPGTAGAAIAFPGADGLRLYHIVPFDQDCFCIKWTRACCQQWLQPLNDLLILDRLPYLARFFE